MCFASHSRVEADTRLQKRDECPRIGGDVAAHAHLAKSGIGEFGGPAGLARDFSDCFVQRFAVEGEHVLLRCRRVRASRAYARRALSLRDRAAFGDGDSLRVGQPNDPNAWIEACLADFNAPELNSQGGRPAKAAIERIAMGRQAQCTVGGDARGLS